MKELRADTIIREIRKFERREIFGNIATESVPGSNTKDMGGGICSRVNGKGRAVAQMW
jgi:hypothetical protein